VSKSSAVVVSVAACLVTVLGTAVVAPSQAEPGRPPASPDASAQRAAAPTARGDGPADRADATRPRLDARTAGLVPPADDTVPPLIIPGLPDAPTERQLARAGAPRKVRVLVIRIHWGGKPPAYPDTGTMRTMMKDTSKWFAHASRGRHHLSSKVTPWLKVSGGLSNCGDLGGSVRRAVGAARHRGIGPGGFNRFMIVMPQCGTNSLGEMPGRVTWIREAKTSAPVLEHELGHNLGLHHANSSVCIEKKWRVPQAGKCSTQEYGDMWDAMGLSSQQYSVGILKRLGWAGRVATASGSGKWTLKDAAKSGNGLQGLRVKVSGRLSYWLEYRTDPVALAKSPGSFEIKGTPGLQIRIDNGDRSMRVIDAAPGNPIPYLSFPDPDFVSVALPVGSSFTTPQGVRITLVSQTSSTATVQVARHKKATKPSAPQIVSAVKATNYGSTLVRIKPPADDGGQVVLGYELTSSSGDTEVVKSPGGTKTEFEMSAGNGIESWTAKAINQVGTSPASGSVKEYVPAPTVAITSPAPGSSVAGPAFAVTATATPDPVSGSPIDYVQVCSLNSGCETDQTAPYTFTLYSYDVGPDTLTATAWDELGGKGVSAPLPVLVQASPPSVQVLAPPTVTAFEYLQVSATVTPNATTGSPVDMVAFELRNSAGEGESYGYDYDAPYTAELWVPGEGDFTVVATATDQNGYASAPSTTVVHATAPPP